MDQPAGTGRVRGGVLVRAAIPALVVALAYLLWRISDAALMIGPLDRAAFGWVVVIPLLVVGPVLGAIAWAPLPDPARVRAAVATAMVVGVPAAVLTWGAFAFVTCETAPAHLGTDWIAGSAFLGGAIGIGTGVGALVGARRLVPRGTGASAVAGVAAALAINVLGLVVAAVTLSAMMLAPMCERPVV